MNLLKYFLILDALRVYYVSIKLYPNRDFKNEVLILQKSFFSSITLS